MNAWDKCKNCGGDYGLHHYETDQCPVGGYEAPIGRKQEWRSTTFERNNEHNETSEYNAALEWAANWITGSQMLGHSADVEEFAKNMAMSIRAAKRPTSRALDAAVCRVVGHDYVDNVCAQCGSLEPPRQ